MPFCNCCSLKPQHRNILINGLGTVCCACRALLSSRGLCTAAAQYLARSCMGAAKEGHLTLRW